MLKRLSALVLAPVLAGAVCGAAVAASPAPVTQQDRVGDVSVSGHPATRVRYQGDFVAVTVIPSASALSVRLKMDEVGGGGASGDFGVGMAFYDVHGHLIKVLNADKALPGGVSVTNDKGQKVCGSGQSGVVASSAASTWTFRFARACLPFNAVRVAVNATDGLVGYSTSGGTGGQVHDYVAPFSVRLR